MQGSFFANGIGPSHLPSPEFGIALIANGSSERETSSSSGPPLLGPTIWKGLICLKDNWRVHNLYGDQRVLFATSLVQKGLGRILFRSLWRSRVSSRHY